MGQGTEIEEKEFITSGNPMDPSRFNHLVLSILASPQKGKYLPGNRKYLQNIHALTFHLSSLKLSMSGSSLVAPVPTQTVLLPPDVLTDCGMSQLGLGFVPLTYLGSFGAYWSDSIHLLVFLITLCSTSTFSLSFLSMGNVKFMW